MDNTTNGVTRDHKEAIVCPYCFKTFSHREVHFRMESYFDENNLNDEAYQEEELAALPDGEEKTALLEQTRERKPFMIRDDPLYTKWWKRFGETTERACGRDRELPYPVYQLPVLNPGDPADQEALTVLHPELAGVDRYLDLDGDGMAVSVTDRFGEETKKRVCPFCHNPLPIHYGKSEVRFISMIGVTGSGKTVYLSQMLKNMAVSMANLKISVNQSPAVESFYRSNPVELGKPLPPASVEGRFAQPLICDISKSLSATKQMVNTIVLYDIAGEDCQNADKMDKYGKFVQHSDGIILLVDPMQLDLWDEDSFLEDDIAEENLVAEPQLVLQTIRDTFLHLPSGEKCGVPLAVCVSKSDSFLGYLEEKGVSPEAREVVGQDVGPVLDERTGQRLPVFNAAEYNKLNQTIGGLTRGPLMTRLENGFSNYNYFTVSATGGPVAVREDENGVSYKYLKGPASPRRIAEPLYWMLYKFGYIRASEPVLRPAPLPEPEKRYRLRVRTGLFSLRAETVVKWESEMTQQDWRNSPEEVPLTAEELRRLAYED